MLHWDPDIVARLDAAVNDAFAGRPRAVVIHGGPGSGRSSLLATAIELALSSPGRRIVHWPVSGVVKGDRPLQGLRDVGIPVAPQVDRTVDAGAAAERALRDAVDDALEHGDLLVTIDDLQWLDPESVEAVTRLLTSAVAERLLVIATVGHFEPFQHTGWQRLVSSSRLVVPIELSALPRATASAVARELRPEIPEPLVDRLWEHTQGNPLFLTSLLRRIDLADLERMEQLPAPDEYARAIEVRLVTLGEGVIDLARAAAVIGVGWMPLAEASYVAALADPARALDVLDSEFILERRMTKLGVEVRLVHAVIQASIYQHIPITERVKLHARAAAVASDQTSELRHRYAAAATYDEELAIHLVDAADVQSAERSHRLAATYLDWAARISADGMQRSTRSMDSFYQWILAGSADFVSDRLPDIRRGRDRSGAALVQGALHVLNNEWISAARVLSPFADAGDDSIRAYRIEILFSWANLCSGGPTESVIAPLRRAESMSRHDDALAGLATFATAMMATRLDTAEAQIEIARLPSRPAAVLFVDSYWLAWRGLRAVYDGLVADAVEPLREVHARMATGLLDVADGLTHAFLGLGYQLAGFPELAAQPYRVAESRLRQRPHPMTAVLVAIGHIAVGDRERASELLTAASTTLLDMPWGEAVDLLLVGRVQFLREFGDEDERSSLLAEHRRLFGATALRMTSIDPLLRAEIAYAALWCNEFDTVEVHAAALERREDLPWAVPAALTLRGLIAERRGDLASAFALLSRAVELDDESLPLSSTRMAVDLERVAAAAREPAVASASAGRARRISARINAMTGANAAAHAVGSTSSPDLFQPLSDRERDVAALVVRGMSYAQIARELFITRSTVGFHLSRIYAKTGTATRHELSELVGREPH